jgi:ribonuclease HIII
VTYTFAPDTEPAIVELLETRGFRFTEAPYAHWKAQVPGCTIVFYNSGKLVIQGREEGVYSELLSPRNVLETEGGHRFGPALEKHPVSDASCWIGSDESGKGDYFGPLVVCSAWVERSQMELLDELGAADSKVLSDKKILEIAPLLKAATDFSLVTIPPSRYNTLHKKMGSNLNRLLAWAHARAIENLLERHPETPLAIVDKFAKEFRVERALMELGREITLHQRTRAEDDPAVAVASIIARNEFIWQMRKLSKKFGVKLAKGAGPTVLSAGKKFLQMHDRESLGQVAKLHFKTTESLIPNTLL